MITATTCHPITDSLADEAHEHQSSGHRQHHASRRVAQRVVPGLRDGPHRRGGRGLRLWFSGVDVPTRGRTPWPMTMNGAQELHIAGLVVHAMPLRLAAV